MGRQEAYDAHRRGDVALLVKQLRGGDAETRSMAAYYLGRLRSADAVPALIDGLDDQSEWVQMSALRALSRIGDRRAVPRISRMAETDPVLALSRTATDALAELRDPRAIGQFVSLLTETDRHLAGGRHQTWIAKEKPSETINAPYAKVKRRIQKWAARRLVELRTRGAAPAIEAAARTAASRRERFLLRRTARRLRHPPWRVRHPEMRLRSYLWWWVVLLVVFVLAARVSGNGSTAWAVTQDFALSILGLVVLIVCVAGFFEVRERRRRGGD